MDSYFIEMPYPILAFLEVVAETVERAKDFTPLVIIGSVFAVLKAGVDSIKIANEYRNLILGITERRVKLNEWQMMMIYSNDWLPLQVGISFSFLVFMILYLLVPFYYDPRPGGQWSGFGSAFLLLIATLGNIYGAIRDRISIMEHIERHREVIVNEQPREPSGEFEGR